MLDALERTEHKRHLDPLRVVLAQYRQHKRQLLLQSEEIHRPQRRRNWLLRLLPRAE